MTPRRTFGPVVLAGLVSAALTAVAAAKPWVTLTGTLVVPHAVGESGRSPLAGALALVLLATWGVVLVTRGRVRRVVAVLGLLAALGVLACVVAGALHMTDDLETAVKTSGFVGTAVHAVHASRTGWVWVAGLGALISVAATAVAVLWAPAWPAMSKKYDAPGGTPDEAPEPGSTDSIDLWKSMDEGHDPTR